MPSSIAILLLTFAIVGTMSKSSNNRTSPGDTLPSTYYLKYLIASSLQLGESCSWSDETFRQAGSRKMSQFPKDSTEADQVFDSIVSNTVQKGRTYCSTLSMLVCDKNTARCVCGEIDVQAALGNRYKPTNYITELDAGTGNTVCRYDRGAACRPAPAKTEDGFLIPKCAQGLSCNYVKDGSTCTNLSLKEHAVDSIRNNEPIEDYLDGVLTGKRCKCEDEVADHDTSTNWNERSKRSLREDEETYAQAKSTFIRLE